MRMAIAIAILSAAVTTVEAAALSDPTQPMDFVPRPSAGGPAVPAGPVLQSTMISPERRSAMISGKRVKIGDKYEGSIVTDIAPYEVRMSRGGRETTLRLLPKLVKEKGRVE